MKRVLGGFEGVVDDCWAERWDPGTARACHMTEDQCFAALRVTFTLTREQAVALLGEGNLPRLPVHESAVTTEDMPRNGQRWRLVRADG